MALYFITYDGMVVGGPYRMLHEAQRAKLDWAHSNQVTENHMKIIEK